jgi:hypothetical protein
MTTKQLREAVAIAENEGLKSKGVINKNRHFFLKLENKSGAVMLQPITLGSGDMPPRDRSNLQGQFRRFARGMTHGLRVINYGG